MSDISGYLKILLLAIAVLVVFGTTLRVAWLRRKESLHDAVVFTESFREARWYKKLNLGAFLFAPVWLLSNGFWGLAAVYLFFSVQWPVFALLASSVLFFKASSMSWGDGSRWGNDSEAFMDEQAFWSTLGWVVGVSVIVISIME